MNTADRTHDTPKGVSNGASNGAPDGSPHDGDDSGGFNLSAWGLRHPSFLTFLIVACLAVGAVAYRQLGRAEFPKFNVKTMVVAAAWPGATARDVEEHVTDRIERALQTVPDFDYVTSYSRPGQTVMLVNLKDGTREPAMREAWYQVRKRVGDMRGELPAGVVGPVFDDDFADTYGTIYAVHADGFTGEEQKRFLLAMRQRFLRVSDVSKVQLLGVQDERVYVEPSPRRLAASGITTPQLIAALARENAVAPSGTVETPNATVPIRLETGLDAPGGGSAASPDADARARSATLAAVAHVPIAAGGRSVTVGDVAEVRRGPIDPAPFVMRHDGARVVGLAVSMAEGGDILALGQALERERAAVQRVLPAGVTITKIADQPAVVDETVEDFVHRLAEAVAVVLLVTVVSVGWRSGMVVALSIPLVLAVTFLVMRMLDIGLDRISLGALIIALGLLVDDAMIAIEMIMVKLEEGWDHWRAASYAWTSTAFPMLSGTLITAAGFMPVGFARSSAGEFTGSIFWVVVVALLVSWVVAVLFIPFVGYRLVRAPHGKGAADDGEAGQNGRGPNGAAAPKDAGAAGAGPYATPAYARFRRAVAWCVGHRWLVLGTAAGAFVLAGAGFGLIPQQFFPNASRREVLVDVELPAGSTVAATERTVSRLEALLRRDTTVAGVQSYVGQGPPRFYLSLDPEPPNPAYAQVIAEATSTEASEALAARLRPTLDTAFADVRTRVSRLENGPPVGYPVQFRVLGPDPAMVLRLAAQVRDTMRRDTRLHDVHLAWHEPIASTAVALDGARTAALGLSRADVALTLQAAFGGAPVTQVREGTELIDVVTRAPAAERNRLEDLPTFPLRSATGAAVPLGAVATVAPALEDGAVWRRSRDVVVPVVADIADATQPPAISGALDARLAGVRRALPSGYRIETAGAVEESAKGQRSIVAVVPVMVLVMLTLLMVQLQSARRVALVVLTAPLGLIGVVAALLLFRQPFGFVAQLGVIALAGMIMRNAIILVHQIDQDAAEGMPLGEAIVDAAVRRARPILLTAAAAILAMIPLSRNVFWGPMAVAIMGGLLVATVLTLFVVPAGYAVAFGVREAVTPDAPPAGAPGQLPAGAPDAAAAVSGDGVRRPGPGAPTPVGA